MEDNHWLSVRITTDLPVDEIPITNIKQTVVVWFYFWVKYSHADVSPVLRGNSQNLLEYPVVFVGIAPQHF